MEQQKILLIFATPLVSDSEELSKLFTTLERNFEVINGYYHKMDVELKMPLQLVGPDITRLI